MFSPFGNKTLLRVNFTRSHLKFRLAGNGETGVMSEPTLDMFRHAKEVESFTKGQVIVREGDPSGIMYVVVEGEVDIVLRDNVVNSLGPGGIFGEMALVDHQPRSATAVAKTDCKLASIDERRFCFLIQQTPNFALSVMRVMAARLRSKNALV
jgi:CRP/FNR family transcriptional regulator, cyclic AMP receptor protein